MNIEAKLKHARKRMQQRMHKPLAKHATETMKPSAKEISRQVRANRKNHERP